MLLLVLHTLVLEAPQLQAGLQAQSDLSQGVGHLLLDQLWIDE